MLVNPKLTIKKRKQLHDLAQKLRVPCSKSEQRRLLNQLDGILEIDSEEDDDGSESGRDKTQG
jgi:hypothetical protein